MSEGESILTAPIAATCAHAAVAGAPRETAEARMRRIVDENYAFVWRSLRRLGVPDANVEDAAQQVLVVTARRLDDVRRDAERSFLFGAAIRVAADARRSARRRPEDANEMVEVMASDAPTPEDLATASAERRVLARALDAMPMRLRTVFVLYELEEMTSPEVAAALDLPLGTATSRLRRARIHFNKTIEKIRRELEGGAP
jgi:RNA polymerase sigma-70 factor (ECF subfamily)